MDKYFIINLKDLFFVSNYLQVIIVFIKHFSGYAKN